MATLERSRSRTLNDIDSPPPAFSLVVPTVFCFPAESDELLELGEERLFSGTSNARLRRSDDAVAGPSSERLRTDPSASEEVYTSLGAAQHTFLFALNGLLHQAFEESRRTSPVATRPPSFLPSSVDEAPLIDFSPSSATLERNPYPERLETEQGNAQLSAVVRSLRVAAGSRSDDGVIGDGGEEGLMEELQTSIATIALDLNPLDAQLAVSLGLLLSSIQRLLVVSRLISARYSPLKSTNDHNANLYATLEREVKALQDNRSQWSDGETSLVVGVAREVELAERECLWGRVDELSEQVKALCRARAEEAVSQDPFADFEQESDVEPTKRISETAITGLPRYSKEFDSTHLPPDYVDDHFATDSKHSRQDSLSSLNGVRSNRNRLSTSGNSEKMQRDLDSVSTAIERLYVVSPQLANQRVEPDRRKLRERQLAKLGNAIERLSSGRLDDQRATASPVSEEEPGERRKRFQREKNLELDRLIDQIDRAASRTLADQRVDLNLKRREMHRNGAGIDVEEETRRDYILAHVGKGRIASQDAVFSSPSKIGPHFTDPFSPSPATPATAAVSMTDFFRSDDSFRQRSHSLPIEHLPSAMKKKFSTSGLFQTFKKGVTPPATLRRGSLAELKSVGQPGMTRTASTPLLNPSVIQYIVEEAHNLDSLTVNFWTSDRETNEIYSLQTLDSQSLGLVSSLTGTSHRITLPSPVESQPVNITSRGTYFEIKLSTLQVDSTASFSSTDIDVQYPLSTNELRTHLPTDFSCKKCQNILVDSRLVTKYNTLPSEHWAELLDSWMCHGDQELSEDLIRKGKGIKPRAGEGLVAAGYIMFEKSCTRGWVTRSDDEGTKTDTDDLLLSAYCATCDSLVGYEVRSLNTSQSIPIDFRLLKYASSPNPRSIDGTTGTTALRTYSLATHLMAQMLEIGRAHACHRFVVEDVESETARVLLWLFNPAIKVSFSEKRSSRSSSFSGARLIDAGISGGVSSQTYNAVKTFYTVVADESSETCQDFINSEHFTTERIAYPRAIVEELIGMLDASRERYPVEMQRFDEMSVGFLERI